MTERVDPQAADEDLDDLRAELARFVLREAGRAVATDPSLPLSVALTQAIREEAGRAVQQARSGQPTPEDIAASVVRAVRPELVQIVRAAARGDASRLEPDGLRRVIASMPGPLLAAMMVFGLLVVFALGFGASWMLAPRFRTAEPPPMTQPLQPETPGGAAVGEPDGAIASTDELEIAPTETPAQETLP